MKLETTRDEVLAEVIAGLKESPTVFRNFTFSPLSRIYTLIRAFANALWLFVDSRLVVLQKAIHPHSSEEDDLHEWLRRFGLEWKLAGAAVHRVRVGSSTAPTTDIPIPQGLVVFAGTAENPIRFRFTTTGKLLTTTGQDSEGDYTIEMRVEALTAGTIGNVALGAIAQFESPPAGIDVVANLDEDPETPGTEKESIASVRSRIKLAEISQNQSLWTPAWYLSETLSFAFATRAVFKSAKTLGREGEVEVLVRGPSGPLSSGDLTILENHFEADENNPGGVAHVLLGTLNAQTVNRSVQVLFSDIEYVLSDSALQAIADEYILSLGEAQAWVESDFKSPFFALQGVTGVVVTPGGDETVPTGAVAVYDVTFSITGAVS